MGGSMPKIVNDSKESAFTTQQRRSKAKFVVTKQSSWPGAATRPDKRRCFFLMAPPKCCSSFAGKILRAKCRIIFLAACKHRRTSTSFTTLRFDECPAIKNSRKLKWRTQKQASDAWSKLRPYFQ